LNSQSKFSLLNYEVKSSPCSWEGVPWQIGKGCAAKENMKEINKPSDAHAGVVKEKITLSNRCNITPN